MMMVFRLQLSRALSVAQQLPATATDLRLILGSLRGAQGVAR